MELANPRLVTGSIRPKPQLANGGMIARAFFIFLFFVFASNYFRVFGWGLRCVGTDVTGTLGAADGWVFAVPLSIVFADTSTSSAFSDGLGDDAAAAPSDGSCCRLTKRQNHLNGGLLWGYATVCTLRLYEGSLGPK